MKKSGRKPPKAKIVSLGDCGLRIEFNKIGFCRPRRVNRVDVEFYWDETGRLLVYGIVWNRSRTRPVQQGQICEQIDAFRSQIYDIGLWDEVCDIWRLWNPRVDKLADNNIMQRVLALKEKAIQPMSFDEA